MLKSRRLAIGAAVLAAALIGVTFEAIHASSPTPLTALTIDGAGANPVLAGGHNVSYTGSQVTFSGHDNGFTVSSGSNSVELLPATDSSTLAVGTAATKTTADALDLGLVVTVNGVACVTGAGSVTIQQVTGSGSSITAFAASYKTTCGTSTALIGGEIRFNTTSDYADAQQDVASVDLGSADTEYLSATEQLVTFHAVGDVATHFGAASIGGVNPASFKIVSNTCNNASLAPNATCQVGVRAIPATTGSQTATLSVVTDATIGTRTATLTANGTVGHLGTYHPLSPARLLDTRSGTGTKAGPVGAGGTVHLSVSGHGGVPASGVMSVVLNVTETGATGNSFLTVYPTGTTRPTASNLNFAPGTTEANSVTAPLSSSGQVDIYNSTGTVQLIADVTGYFVGSDALAAGGQYHPLEQPFRLEDSRDPDIGSLNYEDIATPGFTYGDPTVDSHITALAVNITAVNPTAAGWFTAYNGVAANAPNASTLNFPKGKNVANMAVVPAAPCHDLYSVSDCGGAAYANSPTIGVESFAKGKVDILVDIMGYFDDGGIDPSYIGVRYHPITPTRMVDSRSKLGVSGPLTAGQTDAVVIPSALADDTTWALATNVTAVSPTAATFLTVWPEGNRPSLSTLNPSAHQTVANAAYVTLGETAPNQFKVYNNTGTTGLLVDVNGYYEYDPANYAPAVKAQGAHPATAPSGSRARAITGRVIRAH